MLGLEVAQRARGNGGAVIDDHDVVGQLVGFVEVVGGQQDIGAAGDEVADGRPHLPAADRIQAGRRLVEEEQPGCADQAGPEVQPTPLATRVAGAAPISHFLQPEQLDHDRRCPIRGLLLVPEQSGGHHQVLAAGHGGLDRRVLASQTDGSTNRERVAGHVGATHPQGAAGRRDQGGHGAHERRLPRTVRAEDGQDLARWGDQVEAVEGGHLPESDGQVDRLEKEECSRSRRSSFVSSGHGGAPPPVPVAVVDALQSVRPVSESDVADQAPCARQGEDGDPVPLNPHLGVRQLAPPTDPPPFPRAPGPVLGPSATDAAPLTVIDDHAVGHAPVHRGVVEVEPPFPRLDPRRGEVEDHRAARGSHVEPGAVVQSPRCLRR